MRGNEHVLGILSQVLRKELTGINQYFIHAKMCKNWGYAKLAQKIMEESIEEMKHADEVMDRILFLDGQPNLSAYDKIIVGKTVREQLQNDMQLEIDALKILHEGVQLCREVGDTPSRVLLERITVDEEAHLDWLEAQLHQIREIGYESWLAQQIYV
jgi:bacterioferritin